MKNWTTVIACLLFAVPISTLAMRAQGTNESSGEIRDQLALRALVDKFSILADRKEAWQQTELFTEDAVVETYVGGKLVTNLKGRKDIGSTFDNFLKPFDLVYHFNGQHLVAIKGDSATGTLYCLTYLYGTENGKKVKTSIGIRYSDNYVRQQGKWLIAKRTSYFDWRETTPVAQAEP
jgi:hypothetical protein